jgi:hypothetical protein
MALSTAILDEFLKIGKWSTRADDNTYGEMFSQDFFKEIYNNYKLDPANQSNIDAIGLFPLGLAIASWGVSDPTGLPDDPDDDNWKGTSSTGSGKHIMSYGKGGVGIPHADSSFLEKIIEEIKSNHSTLAPKFDQFYALKGTNFDKLYSNGGHCTSPTTTIMDDLDGKAFGHTKWGYGGDSYCSTYNTKATTLEDWQVFQHWIRAALRTREMQNFIVTYWIEHYWQPSYKKTIDANGTIPEAIINCRIRNSGSSKANANIGNSIDDQLTDYEKDSRWGVMLRSANIWEAYSGTTISVRPGDTASTFSGTVDTGVSGSATTAAPAATTADSSSSLTDALGGASIASTIGTAAAGEATTKTGEITAASGLNIRVEPSSSGAKLGAMTKGTQVEVLATSDDGAWYQVKSTDLTGWGSAAYISVTA